MSPFLKEGDIVFFKIYKEGKSKPKPGQIVIFNHPLKNKCLIKRINLVNHNNIEVLGDNIEFSEDSNKFGLVKNEKIIGIFTSILINTKLKNFLTKKEILILWTDYFKPVHLETYPDLHETIWKAAKLCSACKVNIDLAQAEELMTYVEKIHNIFWTSKGRTDAFVKAS